ncbi:hypothetical protein SRB17_10780 [Streptomyces sp. RB17]|uniref:hypothetical protein n=1 Tax=Streptomyces sp. RB17 TaxID=2585197 RepID=UPI001297D583|nr:hypothetical protein [Streptomyces sp. RB17]MQY33118.1 hypothetical protein [Streptomyces sp. RB17]
MSDATALPTGQEQQSERFTFGLISDVFAVLNQHGYVRGSNGDVGKAVGIMMDLVRAYEGGDR